MAYVITKRILDNIFALFGLIFLIVIFIPIAILIKISSKGPVFFAQKRVGKDGKNFILYKFRTMKIGAEEDGAVWARKNDPRAYSFGNFLRKSRLDELPQFLNILKGEMSLVGPRPERPEFIPLLQSKIKNYHLRLSVLPGVTGYAQVMHPYASSVRDSIIKNRYDLIYLQKRSLIFDLKIIIKTFKTVLRLEGR